MSIRFNCSQCGKLLQTPPGSEGHPARCPVCGTFTEVPGTSTDSAHAADSDEAPAWSASQSPFAADDSQRSEGNPFEVGQEENPYASPDGYQSGTTRQLTLSEIQTRVRIPATILFLLTLLDFGFAILSSVAFGMAWWENGLQMELSGMLAYVSWHLTSRAIMLVGCVQMVRLRRRGWALAAAWLAVLPCSNCWCLQFGIGIWLLVVLHHSQIRDAFQ